MSFGITTWRANGSVAMSGANKAGIFIETLTVTYSDAPTQDSNGNMTGSKVYTQIPAGACFIIIANCTDDVGFTVKDDGAGHAKIVWTYYLPAYQFNQTKILVFAKRVNQTSPYGITINNNDGDLALDYTYPVPQYAGTFQPAATPVRSWYTPDGSRQGNQHQVKVNVRTATNRIVLINLPDSASTDIWYACDPFIGANQTEYDGTASGTTTITVNLYVIRPRTHATFSYQVPTLHVFSLDGPISGGNTYGIQYHDANGNLVYDSSAENITISDMQPVNYVFDGSVHSVPVALPSAPGVNVPYFWENIYTSIPTDAAGNGWTQDNYVALMQRKGSILYYMIYDIRQDLLYDPNHTDHHSTSYNGSLNGNYVMAVDISQLSPSSVTGSPISPVFDN